MGSSILSHWCWVLENPETAGGRSSVFSMFSHMFSEGVLGKNILNLLVFSCLASRSPSRRYTWFSRNLDDPPPNISPRHEFGLGPSKRSLLANNPRDWGHSLKKSFHDFGLSGCRKKITAMATMEIFPSLRLPLYLVGFCNFDPPAGLLQIAQ